MGKAFSKKKVGTMHRPFVLAILFALSSSACRSANNSSGVKDIDLGGKQVAFVEDSIVYKGICPTGLPKKTETTQRGTVEIIPFTRKDCREATRISTLQVFTDAVREQMGGVSDGDLNEIDVQIAQIERQLAPQNQGSPFINPTSAGDREQAESRLQDLKRQKDTLIKQNAAVTEILSYLSSPDNSVLADSGSLVYGAIAAATESAGKFGSCNKTSAAEMPFGGGCFHMSAKSGGQILIWFDPQARATYAEASSACEKWTIKAGMSHFTLPDRDRWPDSKKAILPAGEYWSNYESVKSLPSLPGDEVYGSYVPTFNSYVYLVDVNHDTQNFKAVDLPEGPSGPDSTAKYLFFCVSYPQL